MKIGVICILSLFIGTILINSTGFYFYNENMGFSTAVNNYIETHFNGNAPYTAYVFYRLFFKGQIFNCIFNYLLAFFITPMFMRTSLFKENFPKRKKVENLEQNTDENNG